MGELRKEAGPVEAYRKTPGIAVLFFIADLLSVRTLQDYGFQ